MEKLSKTERILEIIDGGLTEAGTAPDAAEAIEGSVYAELEEDERCGFITVEERDLIFSAWRDRYRADRGNVVHIKTVSNITPPDSAA